jgi:hypothetical protein
MSAERKKVLELLATGKITTEEAEKLLNRLDTLAGAESESGSAAVFSEAKPSDSKPLRYLRVEVEKPGSSDNVNVRIPLSFIRASAGLNLLLPQNVQDKLYANGVDIGSLSRLKGQELENVLKELNIQVDESGGKKVRVFCE